MKVEKNVNRKLTYPQRYQTWFCYSKLSTNIPKQMELETNMVHSLWQRMLVLLLVLKDRRLLALVKCSQLIPGCLVVCVGFWKWNIKKFNHSLHLIFYELHYFSCQSSCHWLEKLISIWQKVVSIIGQKGSYFKI